MKNGVLSVCLHFSVLPKRGFKSKASLIVCFLIVNPEFMHYLWLISVVWIWRREMQQCCLRKGPLTKIYETAYFIKSCWAPFLFFFFFLFSFVPSWQGLLYILGQAWKSRPFLLSTHERILSTLQFKKQFKDDDAHIDFRPHLSNFSICWRLIFQKHN